MVTIILFNCVNYDFLRKNRIYTGYDRAFVHSMNIYILHRHPTLSDCTTINNHCVCAENFEYFRKPDHLLQCIQKRKCFHCQRYRAMDRKFESVTASTNLLLIAAALGKFDLFRFLHSLGGCLETKSGIFELRPLHLAIVNGHFNIFCYLLAQQVNNRDVLIVYLFFYI